MGFSGGNSSITQEEIFNKVSEFQILTYYLNIPQIPCVINSPLRKDNRPSFGLYSEDGVKIRYYDYKTREHGDTIDLLSNLWKKGYEATLSQIAEDLPKFAQEKENSVLIRDVKHRTGRKVYSIETDLQCKVRDWKHHDIVYWKKAGITLPWLKFGNIFPISHVIVTKGGKRYVIPADKHAYVYVEFKDGKPSLKIYQPYNTIHKWSNKHDSSVWDLWEQLPETGENLIITSSRKDALCLWANTGIPSCSLQAESYLPKEHVMSQLKSRFKNIFILYDNDFTKEVNYGRIYGQKLAEEFDLNQIEIPEEYESKDPSDLYENHGQKKFQEVIFSLIEESVNKKETTQ